MAITQVQANKAQIGGVNPVSDDGFAYHVLGGVWLIVGSGTPQTTTLKDLLKVVSMLIQAQEICISKRQ